MVTISRWQITSLEDKLKGQVPHQNWLQLFLNEPFISRQIKEKNLMSKLFTVLDLSCRQSFNYRKSFIKALSLPPPPPSPSFSLFSPL